MTPFDVCDYLIVGSNYPRGTKHCPETNVKHYIFHRPVPTWETPEQEKPTMSNYRCLCRNHYLSEYLISESSVLSEDEVSVYRIMTS